MKKISDLDTGTIFTHLKSTWVIRGSPFRNGSYNLVRACMNTEDQSLRPFNVTIEVEEKGTSMKALEYRANPINSL